MCCFWGIWNGITPVTRQTCHRRSRVNDHAARAPGTIGKRLGHMRLDPGLESGAPP